MKPEYDKKIYIFRIVKIQLVIEDMCIIFVQIISKAYNIIPKLWK